MKGKDLKAGIRFFTQALMDWNAKANHRKMPWKGEKDPYKIWLSEIILQQTRVEQGIGYYQRFLCSYPTVEDLAAAPDAGVFKLWEGLGYYSRCRNLLHTAREVVQRFNGLFPADYIGLLNLKGVGPYTAAAIASFAFGLPYAVVDGNVTRVLARFFHIEKMPGSPEGRMLFNDLATNLLDPQRPGAYNQAIMDFGATVCKPVSPSCHSCPLAPNCQAFRLGKSNVLPVKMGKLKRRKRYFLYFILKHRGKVWVCGRTEKDIWRHLDEFFLVEVKGPILLSAKHIARYLQEAGWEIKSYELFPEVIKQTLTHQEITSVFVSVDLRNGPQLPLKGRWVYPKEINALAFPRTITLFLENYKKGVDSIFEL